MKRTIRTALIVEDWTRRKRGRMGVRRKRGRMGVLLLHMRHHPQGPLLERHRNSKVYNRRCLNAFVSIRSASVMRRILVQYGHAGCHRRI